MRVFTPQELIEVILCHRFRHPESASAGFLPGSIPSKQFGFMIADVHMRRERSGQRAGL